MMKIRSCIRAAILCLCLLYLAGGSIATAGTLLPNGMQYFTDNNGLPLSAGCVYFYIPGTANPKDTYTTSAQTTANTNPVQLDAAGRAVIYGTGVYRQVVKASPCGSLGATVWDQITASTDSSVTIYAGASAGTPNAITVTAPGFSGADGQVINYISTNTNTGGATFNPSGFGAIQIVRDSAVGPGALTGGELVATNAVSLIYDATAGTFHILSPVTWPNTSGVPVGTVIPFPGFTAPTNYAFAYGQAVSRTSFSSLLTAYTSAQTGSLSSGSPTITGLSDTSQFARGQVVEAIGINNGTTLLSCTSTTCTMNANATATRSGTMTFYAHGNGDGSTTFNLPDYRGRGLAGRDNMGGVAGNVSQITSATLSTTNASPTATVSSATGLALGMYLTGNANVPSGTTIS
ncbi:MAG: Phage Tail Collar Domain, partial [Bradyrhizobium sp.]|nr:Phage Tail Collar Domain [Bradyrhizobium sp.]